MSKELFDTKNISDLPKSLVKYFEQNLTTQDKILALFDLKQDLHELEVLAALFRKYKLELKVTNVRNKLHKLLKNGAIYRVARGTYQRA